MWSMTGRGATDRQSVWELRAVKGSALTALNKKGADDRKPPRDRK